MVFRTESPRLLPAGRCQRTGSIGERLGERQNLDELSCLHLGVEVSARMGLSLGARGMTPVRVGGLVGLVARHGPLRLRPGGGC